MLVRFFCLCLFLGATGCTENDPEYCDDSAQCPNGFTCERNRHICHAGGIVRDMSMPDLAPILCKRSTECTDLKSPACQADGKCGPCSTTGPMNDGGMSSECVAAHSMDPFCVMGACVECSSHFDCIGARKSCDDAKHTCVACAKNTDCASGLCNGGMCADPKTLIYVDGKACPGPGQGTFESPFCKVQAGINAATKSTTVIVFGGMYSEDLSIDSTMNDVITTLIGVNAPTLAAVNAQTISIHNDGSHQLTLVIDGFTIGKAPFVGISCTGKLSKTSVRLLRSRLTNSGTTGMEATNCDVTIDQSFIGPNNRGGGLLFRNSDFTIMNTIISRNGSPTGSTSPSPLGGIDISTVPSHAIIFNVTVADNAADNNFAPASGINCQFAGPIVVNTLVFGNAGGKVQINADKCKPDHSAFPGATGMGTNNLDLISCMAAKLFADSINNDYHPVTGGMPPCTLVDAGTNSFMGQAAPTYDLEGKSRPARNGFDIGAYEAQ